MGINSALGSSALLPAGLGFRNVIINGGFDVWQRGTSATIPSTVGTAFQADRWSAYRGVGGSTQSRVSADLDGFQYALRLQRNSGDTSTSQIYVGTSMETSSATKLANKTVTVSFYARAGANYSAAANYIRLLVLTGTGTEANGVYAGYTNPNQVINTTAPTLTTSWQRFTYSAVMPSVVTQLCVQLSYVPSGTAGAADYVDITGVQLEQNYQPTPFEQRPIGIELYLCMRYFQKVTMPSMAVFSNSSATSGITTVNGYFIQPMRIAPAIANTTGTLLNISANTTSTQTVNIDSETTTKYRFYPNGTSLSVIYMLFGLPELEVSAEL
jgi:hypothetical protein